MCHFHKGTTNTSTIFKFHPSTGISYGIFYRIVEETGTGAYNDANIKSYIIGSL